MDTLKVISSLDACQPPPLRNALARLWVAYLKSGEATHTITAASWLLDQIKNFTNLKTIPAQAIVFVECASQIFNHFIKLLLPMAHDCATSLMKISLLHETVP